MRLPFTLLVVLLLAGCNMLPNTRPEATAPSPSSAASVATSEAPTASPAIFSATTASPIVIDAPTSEPTSSSTPLKATATAEPATTGASEGAVGIGDPLYPQLGNGGYDVQRYTLDLDVDVATNTISATATIEARTTQELARFNLDLFGLEVRAVSVDDQPATSSRDGQELTITPATPLARDAAFSAVISYGGEPEPVADPSSAGIFDNGWTAYDDGVYIVSEPAGAMSWYPVNNHPADKAAYTFRVSVPDPFVVAANGVLRETIDEGAQTTYVWHMDNPMASYLATLHIARLEVETSTGPNGLLIRNYFPESVDDEVRRAFDRTGEMIGFINELIAPYPFDAYGVAVVDLPLNFALETQSISTFGNAFVDEEVVLHELAHQWFGDSISPANWSDIWLNEGFASYFQILWIEREQGSAAAERRVRGSYDLLESLDSVPPPVPERAEDLFDVPGVYIRGSLALHALRVEVGDERFFEILRTYYQRHQGGTASTDDFLAVAVELGGDGVAPLMRSWLYGTELPSLPR